MDQEKLIKQLKLKNKNALEFFVNNYANLIFKASYSILKNKLLSEECTNDVF